jgi:nifR3 family TIM-barrel protein
VATHPDDQPLSVQIYGGVTRHIVKAAKWLEDHGYSAVDINMGCPMAKIAGQGGGARLMCDTDGACGLVSAVVNAVKLPVTVKMRLGWDREQISAPALAREFEQLGVAAITIHGRTRAQGFRGAVDLEGIRAVVEAVERIPVIGNGDVRTVADACRMREETGCDAVAIGRGALIDPWIFRRLQIAQASGGRAPIRGELVPPGAFDFKPSPAEQIDFLRRHFQFMVEQHGEFQSCRMFRKFAAWSGAGLGIPEDLEDRLRRFESIVEFEQIVAEIRERHGTRRDRRATWEVKVPNGPVEYW